MGAVPDGMRLITKKVATFKTSWLDNRKEIAWLIMVMSKCFATLISQSLRNITGCRLSNSSLRVTENNNIILNILLCRYKNAGY